MRVTISGAGSYEAGELRISGSGKARGHLRLRALSVSGRFLGDNISAHTIKTSGSARFSGDMEVSDLKSHGSLIVVGNIRGHNVRVAGNVRARSISAGYVEIKGSLRTEEDVECDRFILRMIGASRVGGTIRGRSEVDIRREKEKSLSIRVLGIELIGISRRGERVVLEAKRIEGRRVYIEYTVCDEVIGDEVIIGPECEVRRGIYYASNLSIDPSSKVLGLKIRKSTPLP
ncbi:MAG: hypothetical protein DRN15_04255 [Thermoprotei archaeon]|nr:MAG: hypothetical protein DRN15_04255 [Thermoprotei archaeon]